MDTRFLNTNTNKIVFGVRCKYFNIVNSKNNIQHCMQKWTARSANLELSIFGAYYFNLWLDLA